MILRLVTLQNKGLKCLIFSLITVFTLTACETVEKSRFSDKKDDKKAVETYIQLGYNYIAEENTERARASLLKAIEIDDEASEAHALLAYTFQLEKETEIADKHFKRAIDADATDGKSRNMYANFLYQEGRFQEAADQLKEVLKDEYYPNRSQIFENLGFCYVQLKNNEAAINAFDRAVTINNQLPRSNLALATIFYEEKNVKKSKYYYNRFSKLVSLRRAQHTPRSLWLGISIARDEQDQNKEASLALLLKNFYPNSLEYKKYKELVN